MRVERGLEGKVISKLTVMMIMESKLDKNGSRLIVLAKCMSVVMATLISVKRHVKIILEKKYWLIIQVLAIVLKNRFLLRIERYSSYGFPMIPVY